MSTKEEVKSLLDAPFLSFVEELVVVKASLKDLTTELHGVDDDDFMTYSIKDKVGLNLPDLKLRIGKREVVYYFLHAGRRHAESTVYTKDSSPIGRHLDAALRYVCQRYFGRLIELGVLTPKRVGKAGEELVAPAKKQSNRKKK